MSQKKNNGRQFTVNLDDDDDDDDDDYLDFGTDDDFDNMEDVHNLTLAELFDRDEQRRLAREREDAERRRTRRAQTQVNTLSNAGINFFIVSIYFFSRAKIYCRFSVLGGSNDVT